MRVEIEAEALKNFLVIFPLTKAQFSLNYSIKNYYGTIRNELISTNINLSRGGSNLKSIWLRKQKKFLPIMIRTKMVI